MLSIIVAMDVNQLIGKDNGLPWHLPEDLKFFKRKTSGHSVIMGRNTYESIVEQLGKPLPNRHNIIMTTDKAYLAPGCEVVHSIDEAMAAAKSDESFVIGGAKIYNTFLPKVSRLYITRIGEQYEGDTHFPDVDWSQWFLTYKEPHQQQSAPECFAFMTCERRV